MRGQALVIAVLLVLSGCDTDRPTRDYITNVQSMTAPLDAQGRAQDCQSLDEELTDQESREARAEQLGPLIAADAERQFGERIDALNQKKVEDECDQPPAASAPTTAATPASNPIEQCVAACRANTSRSSTQCFDACNH